MAGLPVLRLGSSGPYVKLLQMDLNGLGHNFNNFPIDGIFDVRTQQAVGSFQDDYKLPRDGIADSATWKILTDNVKAVQKLLNSRGYNVGNPDGWYEKSTIDTVMKFQRDNGLHPEGVVNPRTRRKLFNPHPKDSYESQLTSNSINSLNTHVGQLAKSLISLPL
jgi:peptidoglycan L-alanyl-D-glutamate endopeptidase CwlK